MKDEWITLKKIEGKVNRIAKIMYSYPNLEIVIETDRGFTYSLIFGKPADFRFSNDGVGVQTKYSDSNTIKKDGTGLFKVNQSSYIEWY